MVRRRAVRPGYYSVAPVDGDSITILANYPDIDVPVHFIAGNEASKGFITEVTVDGEAVTNLADDNFTVKLGSTVGYKGNRRITSSIHCLSAPPRVRI